MSRIKEEILKSLEIREKKIIKFFALSGFEKNSDV